MNKRTGQILITLFMCWLFPLKGQALTNGEIVNPQDVPFVVSIETDVGYCTAILLEPKVIITASHCVTQRAQRSQVIPGAKFYAMARVIGGGRGPSNMTCEALPAQYSQDLAANFSAISICYAVGDNLTNRISMEERNFPKILHRKAFLELARQTSVDNIDFVLIGAGCTERSTFATGLPSLRRPSAISLYDLDYFNGSLVFERTARNWTVERNVDTTEEIAGGDMNAKGGNPCRGDSGGGLFVGIDNEYYLVGGLPQKNWPIV